MRIISKYSDFYDNICQDFDADITYVRKPNVVNEEIIPSNSKILMRHHRGYPRYLRKKLGDNECDVWFENYVYGIYPYIYSQPIAVTEYTTVTSYRERLEMVLTKAQIDGILSKNSEDVRKAKASVVSELQKMLDHRQNAKFNQKVVMPYFRSEYLGELSIKEECPDVFMKIKAPVFVEYDSDLLFPAYQKMYDKDCKYVTNICFTMLSKNILKSRFDELNNINTYNNIENFLWASKQEPVSEPDNKTRIVSHGFDLKTSFRNM